MRKILTILFLLELLSIQSHAQNGTDAILHVLFEKIDNLENFELQSNYKFINPGVDTVPFSKRQTFYKNREDSLLGYSFIISGNGDKIIYDGFRLITIPKENNVYYMDNIRYDSHALVGLIPSPITIKSLLSYCISNDSFKYELNSNNNTDYQIEIALPYLLRDGFILEHRTDADQTETKIIIIFDSHTLLPKKYKREYIGAIKGDVAFETDFELYETIPFQEISSLDSIPINYKLNNAELKEKSFLYKQAPGFKLRQLNGDSLELYSIRDKYVLLVFSSLRCGACKMALPYLAKLKNKLDPIPLEILVIYSERITNTNELAKYIEENNNSYVNLINGYMVNAEYKILSWPTILLLDQSKKIIDASIGFNEERISKMIEKINN